MDLPLTLQMEIDISAAAHKREIAEGFAKLRDDLLPPLTLPAAQNQLNLLYNQLVAQMNLAASPQGLNWANGLYAANQRDLQNVGMGGAWGNAAPWL